MPNPLDDAKVYTLDDLESWETLRPGLPPSLAVLGHPVAHSVSPQMHNAALKELAKSYSVLTDWRYFKFDIESGQLGAAFELLKTKNFQGTNLTVPFKKEAVKLLTRIILTSNDANENPEFSVEALDAVNTVIFAKRTKARNTDGFGMAQAIEHDLLIKLSGKVVVILGVGGAATEVANECIRQKCAVLWVGGRDEAKRLDLAQQVKNYIEVLAKRFVGDSTKPNISYQTRIGSFDLSSAPSQEWPNDVIIINATTLGMKSDDPVPFDVNQLGDKACVMDMVYNKSGPTKLVAAAQARGLRATDGLSMLVWQGAKSLSIWLQSQAALDIQPKALAPTMMTAACQALGLPPRHA